MASVRAVLDVVNDITVTDKTSPAATPTPQASTLIGSPTCLIYGVIADYTKSTVQYSYTAFQTYTTTGGTTNIVQTNGTSSPISVTGISSVYPNLSVTNTAISSAVSSAGVVTFSMTNTIAYTQTTPTVYNVTTA